MNVEVLEPTSAVFSTATPTHIFRITGVDNAITPRTFTVVINAATVYTLTNGVPSVAVGWSASTNSPEVGVLDVTLSRAAGYADGAQVVGTATYVQTTTVVTSFAFVRAQVARVSAQPNPDQPDVADMAAISCVYSSSQPIAQASVYIQGEHALTDSFTETDFQTPNFNGRSTTQAGTFSATITHRRAFDLAGKVVVEVQLLISPDGIARYLYEDSYVFFTIQPSSSRWDPSRPASRLDRVLPFPALDTLRRAVCGALRPATSRAPTDVLAYARVLRSSLKSMASRVSPTDFSEDAALLIPSEVSDVNALDAAIQDVAFLWEPALREAQSGGLEKATVDLLSRVYATTYPQERVSSVCALLLASAR